MFAGLPPCELSDEGLAALLTTMDSDNALGINPVIPAGFTYLGQFIDHDITFDPNSQLDKTSDPFALTNFRTPAPGPGFGVRLRTRGSAIPL